VVAREVAAESVAEHPTAASAAGSASGLPA